MTNQPIYKLVIQPKAEPKDPTGIIRLRWLLKHLLRAYGMRVIRFEEPTPEERQPPDREVRE